jgi:hypothetical protein
LSSKSFEASINKIEGKPVSNTKYFNFYRTVIVYETLEIPWGFKTSVKAEWQGFVKLSKPTGNREYKSKLLKECFHTTIYQEFHRIFSCYLV